MERTTMKHLQNKIDFLNDKFKDNYRLHSAYGGYRIESKDRSQDILNSGYVSKAKLYDLICAYIAGVIEACKED